MVSINLIQKTIKILNKKRSKKTVSSLECYVCTNQTANTEKCLNTIKTCEPGEDVCLSEIHWGSMPYFSLGAQKQYYVSKRCSTKDICKKTRSRYMPYCTHIWYEDWTCSECCQGDRCNYYIIVSWFLVHWTVDSIFNKNFIYLQSNSTSLSVSVMSLIGAVLVYISFN